MDEVVGEIYITSGYNQFSSFKGNRRAEERRTLSQSIQSNGMLVPIIVNNRYEIGDGQARYLAAKKMKKPILYRVVSDITFEDIIEMNRTTHNWKLSDYVHRYTVEGNEEYDKLTNLHKKNSHIPLSAMARTAMGCNSSTKSVVKPIHLGDFKFYNYSAYLKYISDYNHFLEVTGLKSYEQVFMAYFELYTVRSVNIEKLPNYLIKSSVLDELRGNRSQTNIMVKMIKVYNARHNGNPQNKIRFEIKDNRLPNILTEKSRELLKI
ncbi:ParB N-terminal domain-containing protein [Latilactobacillus curvatus]|uniref:ParB N-terminal domain-containing protein n=1 Tax=Latilactobacillus curvatus TaxID=28038 RepID=UPI002411243C|nr:ParB N-terminal domain-containing protein [Latilactobacillus curvatus]MDG2980172.1 ParB N-terminal domain-containing protein [Latilactobacillus curvatus]